MKLIGSPRTAFADSCVAYVAAVLQAGGERRGCRAQASHNLRSLSRDFGCTQKQPTAWKKTKNGFLLFITSQREHWSHLRTTNPIESTFATVRLRTQRTKGCGSRIATLTMVFKLGIEPQQHWRGLNGSELIPKVLTGVIFLDGEELTQQAA